MSDRILVATRKGLFTVTRGSGGAWGISAADHLGDNLGLTMVDPGSGTILAAYDHGHYGAKLTRSTDGGKSWHECATPEYPEKPEGYEDNDPFSNKPVEWKLRRVWELAPGHSDEPGVIWCGTIPGGLFKSADNGDSWEIVESLWMHPDRKRWFGGGADYPGMHSVCVDPRDGKHVYVAVSCGGVWETTDGGASWNVTGEGMVADYMPPEQKMDPVTQDPHRMTICRAQPDHVWVQHHCGVFKSRDGAKSWQAVPNAKPWVFGFGVAVHPEDSDTAWFVPSESDQKRAPTDGRVCVSRTRDGGETFEELRNGLPQDHAYDLTFRHALDIDETGNSLAFGTTTGSLWVTDDQGDSWQTVAEHLPPIYSVRFG
jgi:hypothetical protein